MITQSAKRSTDVHRNVSRNRRAGFWAGAICVGIFIALSLMAYAGLDKIFLPSHKIVAAPPSEPEAVQTSTGRLVWVDSNGCTMGEFDNGNGQLGAQQYVPCAQIKNPSRQHKQSPLNRFKKFNSGFQK